MDFAVSEVDEDIAAAKMVPRCPDGHPNTQHQHGTEDALLLDVGPVDSSEFGRRPNDNHAGNRKPDRSQIQARLWS